MEPMGDELESVKTEPVFFMYSKGTGILTSTSQNSPPLSKYDAISEEKLESLIAQCVNVDADLKFAMPHDFSVTEKHNNKQSMESNPSLEQLDINVDELTYIPLKHLETKIMNMIRKTNQIDLNIKDSHKILDENEVKPLDLNATCELSSFVQSSNDIKNSVEEKTSPNQNIFHEAISNSEEHTKSYNKTSQNVMLQASLTVSPLDRFTNTKKELNDSFETYSEGSSFFAIDENKYTKNELKVLNDSINFGSETSFEEIENEVERIAFENMEACVDNDIPSNNKISDRNTNLDKKDEESAKFEHFVNTCTKQGLLPSNFTKDVYSRLKVLTKITSNKSKYANPNYVRMKTSCEKSDSISNMKLPEDEPKNEFQFIGDFFREDKNNEKIFTKEFPQNLEKFDDDDDPFICKSDPFIISALLKKDLKSPRRDCNELSREVKKLKVENTTKTQKKTKGELSETKFEQTSEDKASTHILKDGHSFGGNYCTKMSATKEGKIADVSVALAPETLNTKKENFRITKEIEETVIKGLNIIYSEVAESQLRTEENINSSHECDTKPDEESNHFHDEESNNLKKSGNFQSKIEQSETLNINRSKSDNLKITISSEDPTDHEIESDTSFEKIEKELENIVNEKLNSPVSTVNKNIISLEDPTDYRIEFEISFEKTGKEFDNMLKEKINSSISKPNNSFNGNSKIDSPVIIFDQSFSVKISAKENNQIIDYLEQISLSEAEKIQSKNKGLQGNGSFDKNSLLNREEQKKEIKDIFSKALSKPFEEVIDFDESSYDRSANFKYFLKNKEIRAPASFVQHNTSDSKCAILSQTLDGNSSEFKDSPMFRVIQSRNNQSNPLFNAQHLKIKEWLYTESNDSRSKYSSTLEETLSGKDSVHQASDSVLHSIFTQMKRVPRTSMVSRETFKSQESDPVKKISSYIDKVKSSTSTPVTHEQELNFDRSKSSCVSNNSYKSSTSETLTTDIRPNICKQTCSDDTKQPLKSLKPIKLSDSFLENQRDPKIYSLFNEVLQRELPQFPRHKEMNTDKICENVAATKINNNISLGKEIFLSGNSSNRKFNSCDKSCDMDLENDQTLELMPINRHEDSSDCDGFGKHKLELSAEEKRYFYRYRELNAQPTPYFGSVAVFNMLKNIYSHFNVNKYLTGALRMVLAVLSVLFILFTVFIFTLYKWSKKYF